MLRPTSVHPPAAYAPSGEAYRAASTLLIEHGDLAATEIARFGDAALDQGDVLASAYWGRVNRALDDLTRAELRPGETRA